MVGNPKFAKRNQMRIIVCLKPVPDPKHWNKLRLNPDTRTLVRDGIPSVINPLDKHALEAAIQLKEHHGGEVILLSMAPPDSGQVLRESLAMGADSAVLLSDRFFAGSDTLGTAHVLAQAIAKLGRFDLIICGEETIDGGTAQVSAQIAEFLGIANLMHVSGIRADRPDLLQVQSNNEQGARLIEIVPPMVLSVVKELNEPRYVTFMNILAAESKEIKTWTCKDLTLNEACVGLADSPTQMADLFMPPAKKKAEMLSGDAEAMAGELADRLHRLGFC
jgi:electron transfer flavoprotein beta subunit